MCSGREIEKDLKGLGVEAALDGLFSLTRNQLLEFLRGLDGLLRGLDLLDLLEADEGHDGG